MPMATQSETVVRLTLDPESRMHVLVGWGERVGPELLLFLGVVGGVMLVGLCLLGMGYSLRFLHRCWKAKTPCSRPIGPQPSLPKSPRRPQMLQTYAIPPTEQPTEPGGGSPFSPQPNIAGVFLPFSPPASPRVRIRAPPSAERMPSPGR